MLIIDKVEVHYIIKYSVLVVYKGPLNLHTMNPYRDSLIWSIDISIHAINSS